ncbi:MAG: PTS sugar transporter subunit IIA [Burkholderiales bacterium]|nr:PTS sugar transporter subunit IIA [Burkholderiales bacterium]
MTTLLIVAHAPLASALQAVAQHVYPDCRQGVHALDVPASWPPDEVERRLRAQIAAMGGGDVLILVDVFGATPCKAAQAVTASRPRTRLVAGVNVPMLWRSVCYAECTLDELAERALAGGQGGVLPVAGAPLDSGPTVVGP